MGGIESTHSPRPHRYGKPRQDEYGGQARQGMGGAEAKKFLAFTAFFRPTARHLAAALVGGLRRGELCGLKWEDIDFDRGSVRLVRTRVTVNGQPADSDPKTKGSRRDTGPCRSDAAPEGAQEDPEAGTRSRRAAPTPTTAISLPMLWGDHVTLRPSQAGLRAPWRTAADCGASRCTAVVHTCATNMLKAGSPDPRRVRRFLGHSSVQITLDVYGHVLPAQEERAVTALVAEYS